MRTERLGILLSTLLVISLISLLPLSLSSQTASASPVATYSTLAEMNVLGESGIIVTIETVGEWETLTNAPEAVGSNNGHRIEAMGNYVYFWVANSTGFYRYNPSAGSWETLTAAPNNSSYGTGIVRAKDTAGNPAIYIIAGTTFSMKGFYRYTEYNDSWVTLNSSIPWSGSGGAQPKPANGSEFAWDGEDTIYYFPGSGYSYNRYDWYKYTISSDSWTYIGEFNTSGDPKNGPGNSACFVTYGGENYIFIQFGHTPSSDYKPAKFMRYQISTDNWWTPAQTGYGADDGADLVWDGGDNLYVFPGAYEEGGSINEYRFLVYSIPQNQWTSLPDFPSPKGQGNGSDDGGAAGIVGSYIYYLKGGDGNGSTLASDFYRYQMAPATPTAWATGPKGSTNNPSVTLTYTYTGSPDNVKLYYTKDGGTSWTLAGEDTSVDGTFAYNITSGDGTYGWNAVAIGGGSTETDPPAGGTPPEAASLILDRAPTLIAPANGFSENDNTPTFEWSSVSSPGGVTYQIQIDDNVDFISPVYFAVGLVENNHTLPGENALACGTYFWRVRAVDNVGNALNWSSIWTLYIIVGNRWTQTNWAGGPTKPSLQVGTWDNTYDNFYDNDNVNWLASVRLDNYLGSWVTDHVVISEFSTRGSSSAYDEFVELYNPTSSAIDIGNWIFEYWNDTAWVYYSFSSYVAVGTIPSGATIPAHGFYLWGNNRGYSGPTPDWNTYGGGLADGASGSPRGIRLKMPDNVTVIDTVVYEGDGNTSNPEAEGGLTATNIDTAPSSVERKAQSTSTASSMGPGGADEYSGNAYDSNNNYSDFIRRSSRNPQNSSSTLENPVVIILSQFRSAGWFESSIYDAGGIADWKIISWIENKPSGTSIIVKARTGNDNNPYDGGWSGWYQHSNGAENALMENRRYVQYRVELSTTDIAKTPKLSQITLIYELIQGIIRGVDVSISPSSQVGAPGATLIYTVTVNNTGNVSDTYTLDNTDNLGWTKSLSNTSLVVAPFSSDNTTTLSVTIPMDAAIGTIDNITVTANGTGVSDSASCTAQVPSCGVDVTIENALLEGYPSQVLEYTIDVHNSGNVVDNINLSYIPDGWPDIYIDPPVLIDVAPCEWRQATMYVHVPDNAVPCTYKEIIVVAESEFCHATDNDKAQTHVIGIRGVDVTISPSARDGQLDENLIYDVVVKNTGSVTDGYILELTETLGWPHGWDPVENLRPTHDAQVRENYPTTNYGNQYNMYVGVENTNTRERSYLKFDLASIPTQSTITSATLSLMTKYGPSHPPGYTDDNMWIQAMSVSDDSWTELGINWSNAPAPGAMLDNVYVISDSWVPQFSRWYWDVTSFVTNEFAGDKVASFCMMSKDEEDMPEYNTVWFYQKDGGNSDDIQPWLEVIWEPTGTGEIAPGDNWTGLIWVEVSGPPCTTDTLTVRAASIGDPMVSDSDNCTAHAIYIIPVCGVEVNVEPPSQEGYPSQVLEYTIDVHNSGNTVDNFSLSYIPDGWPDITIVPLVLTDVMPSEHRQAKLYVHVPDNAIECTYKEITVVVESEFCGATDNDTAQAHATETPVATYTYPSSYSAVKGTVTDFANQQSADDEGAYSTLAERSVPGGEGLNFTETFEHGGGIPAGWTFTGNMAIKSTGTGNHTPGGTYSAGVTAGGKGTVHCVISETIDYTGASNPHVNFWCRCTATAGGSLVQVDASIDGGATYTVPVTAQFSCPGDSTHHQYFDDQDISSLAGQSNVKFKWTYTRTGGYFNMDDIQFTASAGTACDMEIYENITSIPAADNHTLEMRYKLANTNDTFNVQIWDGSAWNTRGSNLDSTSWTDWSYTLLGNEVISGTVQVRFVDVNPNSTPQDNILKDYLRVKSEKLLAHCGVEVIMENALLEGYPSQVLEYTIDVYNSGNVVDNFNLSYIPDGWPDITIVPLVLTDVMPSEHRQATMFVHVPDNAIECTYKEITVVAESQFCGATDNDTTQAHVIATPVTVRGPILIVGNDNFIPEKGVNGGGSGTELDPYIIENWIISAENAHGIEIRNTTAYFVVRNCVIENGDIGWPTPSYYGIKLQNVANGRIENNLSENNNYGIVLYANSRNNVVTNNDFENYAWYGVRLEMSHNNLISNNFFDITKENTTSATWAIGLWEADNNDFENNTVENRGGIYLYNAENIKMRNNIHSSISSGLAIEGDNGNLLHFIHDIDNSNLVNGKPVLYLIGHNNEVIGPSQEIGYLGLVNCDNILVENLVFARRENNRNLTGILMANTQNSRVENCAFENNTYGIYITCGSNNNILTHNSVDNNSSGIDILFSSDNNIIEYNTITNNRANGILFYKHPSSLAPIKPAGFNNTIRYNNITLNYRGIYIPNSNDNNRIYHNNIINNTLFQAYDNGSNYWDDGYPSGGNYWSDYTGEDNYRGENQNVSGSDGIGDTPYYILGDNNQDRYPLMNPWAPTCGVEVTIENTLLEGCPSQVLEYTISVHNSGAATDNIILSFVPDGWPDISIDPPVLIDVASCEWRQATMFVHVPDNASPCTYKEIIVIAESEFCHLTDNDSAQAHVVAIIQGTAVFSLKNLYTVNVEKILEINLGSKLVVKFYAYNNTTYEGENVIETFVPPVHVEENEHARHPTEGIGVKKARLDLTTDDTGNVISTIASYTVRKIDLETRFSKIPSEWFLAPPGSQERTDLETEFSKIPSAWFLAPS